MYTRMHACALSGHKFVRNWVYVKMAVRAWKVFIVGQMLLPTMRFRRAETKEPILTVATRVAWQRSSRLMVAG
ncbi:unnamed protein product [Protopolystoma xenopodis]|uniref:Uncharacterized protein n=1 Tax=Protopolystoma xenopodis TaxID=117903 RepID=A0A3S5BP80_9PLAT|nr:unnamed protein product [Protopolystoma xenopodis]